MKHVAKILFLADSRASTPTAFSTALELARRTQAHLTVAEIQADGELLTELMRDERRAALRRLLAPAGELDLSASLVQLDGPIPEVLAGAVEAGGIDLVVKSADPSADPRLLRACPVPLWTVRPPRSTPRRVLATIDPFGEGRGSALNRAVLEYAAAIAELWSAEFHVVSAWAPRGLESLAGPRRLETLEEEARRAQQYELRLLPEAAPQPSLVHLVGGGSLEVIREVARREAIDLVVAGTVARDGVSGLVVGNTAERLLRQVDGSLLVLPAEAVAGPRQISAA